MEKLEYFQSPKRLKLIELWYKAWRKHNKAENSADADVTPNTKKVPFFSIASFQEQWRDWGGIMGWFVPFLLPWDKQQLESSSTAQYLEQTIPSDCIKRSEIRLNESDERWRLYVFVLLCSLDLARKMDVDDGAIISQLFHHGCLINWRFVSETG